jgi:hypothetical protein
MLRRTAEEAVVNLILLFGLSLLTVMLLPSHIIQLALCDLAGAYLEMQQTLAVLYALVFHAIDSVRALVFSIPAIW